MRYQVTVKFHQDFVKVEGDSITIGLTSKPVKGKANAELVKKLAKHFGVSPSNVRIIAGFKSKKKIVEII
ncbi:DUF167 domain-containing protein [Candidatus Bathyarchaeota archaeon]|nr:MAG: DUF167 domain-containing protein [Candidatus Bathyarchaeota archaeon]